MRAPVLLVMMLCLLLGCKRSNATFSGNNTIVSDDSDAVAADSTVRGNSTQKTETKHVADEVQPLDILLVLDNSGSMEEAHKVLSSKLEPLISAVANSDWQIGIITTDVNDCYRSIVRKGDNEADFTKEISRLISITPSAAGSRDIERAIASATKALNMELQLMRDDGEPSCDGDRVTDWPRVDTTLAVLIVTDEDIKSRIEARECDVQCMQDFYDLVKARIPAGYIYGIINTNLGFLRKLQHGESMFTMQHQIYTELNSYVVTDFSHILTAISKNVASKVQNVFMLENHYDGGEAHLTLSRADGSTFTPASDSYSIEGRVLTIEQKTMQGVDSLTISYSWKQQP